MIRARLYEILFFDHGLFLINFCRFLINIWKSIDVVLGNQTLGCRMVRGDGSTELWRPTQDIYCLFSEPISINGSNVVDKFWNSEAALC